MSDQSFLPGRAQIDFKLDEFFDRVDKTDINGRNLELLFPLFIISKILYNELFEEILEIGKRFTKERKIEEMTESRDVLVYEFSAQLESRFYNLKLLTDEFKQFIDYVKEDEYKDWLNPKWFGRALKRLELIIEKKRMAYGREIKLDISKAQEKIKIFK